MWRNYLTTAFRNLSKQRFYSLINIIGLAVGLGSCLLISLFVIEELTYDRHHPHAERVYRLRVDLKFGETVVDGAVMPAPLAQSLEDNYPEVEVAARFRQQGSRRMRPVGSDQSNIEEQRIAFADPEVFDIFHFDILDGDPAGLAEPNTIAISRSARDRQFGTNADVIGKSLLLSDRDQYEVVVVYEDLPSNNHFHFDFLLAMAGLEEAQQPIWLSHNFVTYVRLRAGSNPEALVAKFPQLITTNVGPQLQQFMGSSIEEMEAGGDRILYFLQPLTDIHLTPDLLGELEPGGDMAYVYIFSAVAIFLLLIACINFMNLATARSANRAREVGVRKALGSLRSQLILQFMVESMLVVTIATGLGLLLAQLALPWFNDLAGKSLHLPWGAPAFYLGMLGLILVVGFVAGMYPALFLSGFRPVEVLKGKLATVAQNGTLRSALVVFQFATSIVLIVSTIVVQQQLQFVQNRNLGYHKDQILIIEHTWSLEERGPAFKQEVLRLPEVRRASYSGFLPVYGSDRNNNAFWPTGNRRQDNSVILQNWSVDHDYLETLGMEIIEGRNFDRSFPTDSSAVILNETAVRQFGLGDNPLGKQISSFTSLPGDPNEEAPTADYTIIGVVKDFHFESLKDEIAPLGLFIGDSRGSLLLSLQAGQVASVLDQIETMWREEFAPRQPFSYAFMDDRFAAMYKNESRVGKIFMTFAGLAIFIACLGLFALATFMTEQRSKEIGVRKVLGASSGQIWMLLSKDFMKLVGIAILIAVPLGWFFMSRWMGNYYYKVGINAWAFLLAGLIAVLIALVTISSQSWQAARHDPAYSLRDE